MSFHPMAKLLIALGAVLVLAGFFWQFGAKHFPLGRLPGDIVVERESFRFYFPVTTSILISLLLALIGWVIGRFRQ